MSKSPIYLISGLGLDERVFKKLHFPNYSVHFIKWIDPLKNESIEDYARRLLEQIKHEGDITLVGYSFGGMMALEIAKLKRVQQIIQIASIKTKSEIPQKLRWSWLLPLKLMFQKDNQHKYRKYWGKYFGLFTESDLDLFEDMLATTTKYCKVWSMQQLRNWKNEEFPPNLIQINGTNDLLFSYKKINPDHLIEDGTHFMAINHAEKVNLVLGGIFKQISNNRSID
jgi:pimeloyl-ACP methyl ester carboxylesterase